MELSFDLEEAALLREVVATYLSDLRMEIVDTDNAAFRRDLRTRERILRAVQARLDDASLAVNM